MGSLFAGFSTQHICIVKRVRCGFHGANVLIGTWEKDLEVLLRLATTVAWDALVPMHHSIQSLIMYENLYHYYYTLCIHSAHAYIRTSARLKVSTSNYIYTICITGEFSVQPADPTSLELHLKPLCNSFNHFQIQAHGRQCSQLCS